MFFHRWAGIAGKIYTESYAKEAFYADFPESTLKIR